MSVITAPAMAVLTLFAGAAAAQVVPADEFVGPVRPEPVAGIWPTPKLMDSLLTRWADNLSDKFELDAEQRVEVREAIGRRWGRFLNDNRTTIQPLVNEFLEMRMAVDPPSKEAVQDWARRVEPVFRQCRAELDAGTEDLRDALSPLQRAKFEIEVMKFGVGMRVAEGKLHQWREGDFDPREVWIPPRSQRLREQEKKRDQQTEPARAKASAPAAPPSEEAAVPVDQIALELEAWDEYVARFIRMYGLGDAQRDAVSSCLVELKQRALAHRDRRREDIARLEQRIRENDGSDASLAEIKVSATELYGPVDDMFAELKERVERVPTSEQRARVAERSSKELGSSTE